MSGFAPGSVHVRFVMDERHWDSLFWVLQVSPVIVISAGLHAHIYHLGAWTVGPLEAAVRRHGLIPSTWTTWILTPECNFNYNRGHFFSWRNGPERRSGNSFSDGRKPEKRSGTFFPGIGITNITPLQPNFGSLFASRNLFKRKVGLTVTMWFLE
jgi:hypothetical protein